jgi:protoporphyrinogen oxidase
VNRRQLFSSALGFALTGCRRSRAIEGSVVGASSQTGHLLRGGQIPEPADEERISIAILGGGISGLSAGWRLLRGAVTDFRIFELEAQLGGNSRSGENAVTSFPWGAHYVTLPTKESTWVRALFEELGVIESYGRNGEPVYKEEYLCAAPQERLYIHGRWQEGLAPMLAATAAEQQEFKRFAEIVDSFRARVGRDGRKAFAIPMDFSSRDADLLALDRISIAAFLEHRGLRSKPLHWYVNYACRDDFGCKSRDVSAWAGIHYFASRDSAADNVLTWPEGNGWIVRKLSEKVSAHVTTSALVYRVRPGKNDVAVDIYFPDEKRSTRIRAEHVVWACPTFQARFVLSEHEAIDESLRAFEYAPWLVANLTLDRFPEQRAGAPIAWDNVIYDSDSLGYVVATHQSLATQHRQTVLTYYHAPAGPSPAADRRHLLDADWRAWTDFIISDLSKPHPEIRDIVQRVDIMKWGHAMIRPRPGFVWGDGRRRMAAPHGRVHFANSDLSAFSLFEEAQFRGITAAERILRE